jgi:hypothetical protein
VKENKAASRKLASEFQAKIKEYISKYEELRGFL